MNPEIVESTGAHYCPLPGLDRRRGYTTSDNTNIARTIEEHRLPDPGRLKRLDDYDLTDALGHLEIIGGFE